MGSSSRRTQRRVATRELRGVCSVDWDRTTDAPGGRSGYERCGNANPPFRPGHEERIGGRHDEQLNRLHRLKGRHQRQRRAAAPSAMSPPAMNTVPKIALLCFASQRGR